jgi:predicted aconitase
MSLRLDPTQQAMLNGQKGQALQWAMHQQLQVAEFFGATEFVAVDGAQVGAEVGTMGEVGVELVEQLAAEGARFQVPTITAACSVDFQRSRSYGVPEAQIALEQRLHHALRKMGCLDTSTCINYQTVTPPRYRQHLAWGDTGAVAFANGVAGARSNYEAGPASIAAALTGVVPAYGFHLTENRRATRVFEVESPLSGTSQWSALGAWVGKEVADYWTVPAVLVPQAQPSIDELKHFAAAAASFGSIAMFHVVGCTPEAANLEQACCGQVPTRIERITHMDLARAFPAWRSEEWPDLVVFSAPQLSLHEVSHILGLMAGRQVRQGTRMFITINSQVESELERLGLLTALQAAGVEVLSGTCFYVMAPAVVRLALGARTVLTPSTKLLNILQGAGYEVALASVAQCVEVAMQGAEPVA